MIRGLSGYRVQMLNDGLASMDASSLSDDHAVTLETGLAEQIEVLRGPAALLYGSGGAGGAVNVVARRLPSVLPPEPVSGFVELRGDSALGEGTAIGSFDAGAAGLLLHLEGFRRETGDVHIPGAAVSAPLRERLEATGEPVPDSHGRVANSASESEGAGAGLSWFTERGAVGLAFDRLDSEYGLPSEEEASIDMQQNRVDLKGEYRPDGEGAWQALRLRAGYTDYAHTELEAPGEPGTLFFNEMYEVRASADHRLRQDWRGALGVQVAKQDFEAIGEEAFVPPSVTRTLGAFVFEEWTSGDWTLQGGARFDNQRIRGDAGLEDYDANALNLSAGALWQVHPQHVLAFNVTRTQRHPQATELYANGVHAALARVETGNADLGRETGYTLDAAVRSSGGRVTWSVGAFANRYDGFIYAAPTAEIVSDRPARGHLSPAGRGLPRSRGGDRRAGQARHRHAHRADARRCAARPAARRRRQPAGDPAVPRRPGARSRPRKHAPRVRGDLARIAARSRARRASDRRLHAVVAGGEPPLVDRRLTRRCSASCARPTCWTRKPDSMRHR